MSLYGDFEMDVSPTPESEMRDKVMNRGSDEHTKNSPLEEQAKELQEEAKSEQEEENQSGDDTNEIYPDPFNEVESDPLEDYLRDYD